jgi:hypothetical protein
MMIGQTISHYTILEKLGEVPKLPTPACVPCTLAGRSASQRVIAIFSISRFLDSALRAGFQNAEPTFSVGSYGESDI